MAKFKALSMSYLSLNITYLTGNLQLCYKLIIDLILWRHYVTLGLLGKILKRKKRESTDISARSPRARGFTLGSIWRKKNRTLPTDGS